MDDTGWLSHSVPDEEAEHAAGWDREIVRAKQLLHSHLTLDDWSSEGFAAHPTARPPDSARTSPARDPVGGALHRRRPAIFTASTCALDGWDLAPNGGLSPAGMQRALLTHPVHCVGTMDDMGPVYVSGGAFIAYMQAQDAGSERGEGDDEPIYIFDRHILTVPTCNAEVVCSTVEEAKEEVEVEVSDAGVVTETKKVSPAAIATARAAVRAAYGGGAPPRLRAGGDPLDWEKAIFERLPPQLRPALRYLLLAPPRSGTVMHVDPKCTAG